MKVGLELDLYGVHVRIAAPDELWDEIRARLSYASELSSSADARGETPGTQIDLQMAIAPVGADRYFVSRDGEQLLKATGPGAVDYLETQIRQQVSMRSPEKVFIHAGVVGIGQRGIVAPGLSHSGKTSLVAALLAAGASYLSDEYAVLDTQGRVHPFPKPLSIRAADGTAQDHHVQALGGISADSALPVGLIVFSTYRPGAEWHPVRLSGGDAVLKVLRHTAQTRERPAASLRALKRMIEGAVVLSGERDEASEVAPSLIEVLAE